MRKKLKKIMLTILIIILAILLICTCTIFIGRFINSKNTKINTEKGIQESTYININGIKQYIQIRGENRKNPIMIFIHGGPASPMSYVSSYYQKELESKLTIINYDQRGCGRTYYANNEDFQANIDTLIEDLNSIVNYAKQRFNKDKIIIAGHSWGTVIGSIYVQKYPDNVSQYIGISQITNLYQNKLDVAKYALDNDKITDTEDKKTLTNVLNRMSKVNKYEDMSIDDLNQLVSISAKYLSCDGEMSGIKQMITGITSNDMNFQDIKWFMSQMNTEKFFSNNEDVMKYAFFGFDIKNLSTNYKVPVYYLSGEGDYAVCQQDVEEYYNTIKSPDKKLYKLKNVGHSMFMDNPTLYCDTILNILNRQP